MKILACIWIVFPVSIYSITQNVATSYNACARDAQNAALAVKVIRCTDDHECVFSNAQNQEFPGRCVYALANNSKDAKTQFFKVCMKAAHGAFYELPNANNVNVFNAAIQNADFGVQQADSNNDANQRAVYYSYSCTLVISPAFPNDHGAHESVNEVMKLVANRHMQVVI